MPLSVSIGTNGRISRGTNVIIPPENAGIGDIVFCKSGYAPTAPSNLLVVGRGTNSTNSATLNSATYYRYGVIYGFVAGMAMILADTDGSGNSAETSKYYATSGYPSVSDLPIYGGGSCLMRNGKKATYVQMNTAQQQVSDSYRGTAGSAIHPTAAYNGDVMTEATFNGSTEAKKIYGTWTEYLRQTLRVNGAPGTPFGAIYSGTNNAKVHEFGRWMTKTLHARSTSLFPAANYCSTFKVNNTGDVAGNWWLPSMFELGEMLIDSHYGLVNEGLINDISTGSYRWSCVLFSGSLAWVYYNYGMSNGYGISDYQFTVRPVTLLKLV